MLNAPAPCSGFELENEPVFRFSVPKTLSFSSAKNTVKMRLSRERSNTAATALCITATASGSIKIMLLSPNATCVHNATNINAPTYFCLLVV